MNLKRINPTHKISFILFVEHKPLILVIKVIFDAKVTQDEVMAGSTNQGKFINVPKVQNKFMQINAKSDAINKQEYLIFSYHYF